MFKSHKKFLEQWTFCITVYHSIILSEMSFLTRSVGLSLHGGGINPAAMPIFYQQAGSDEQM